MQFKFNLDKRKIYTYDTYRKLLDALLAKKKTTGKEQSDELLAHAKMNLARMSRWDKTTKVNDQLKSVLLSAPKQTWLVLTEGWCGDAAQNLPIISKMADFAFNVDLQIILRDENLDIMDAYLTDGGQSIPKLIAFDEDKKVLFTWGPRPEKMQEKVKELKKAGSDFVEEVHKMYPKDRAVSIQQEFLNLLS